MPTVFPSKFIKLTNVSYLANNTLSEQNYGRLSFHRKLQGLQKGVPPSFSSYKSTNFLILMPYEGTIGTTGATDPETTGITHEQRPYSVRRKFFAHENPFEDVR
ncbi:hypothetical protein GCM10010525_27830 [Glutamicibacter bergerei]